MDWPQLLSIVLIVRLAALVVFWFTVIGALFVNAFIRDAPVITLLLK